MGGVTLKIHPLFYLFGLYYALTGRIFIFIVYTIVALVHELGHPYVKPTTKKFLSFFKFEMAISLRAFLCFALLLGIKEGPQLVPFIR